MDVYINNFSISRNMSAGIISISLSKFKYGYNAIQEKKGPNKERNMIGVPYHDFQYVV